MSVDIVMLLNKLLDGQTEIKVDLSNIKRTVNTLEGEFKAFKEETKENISQHGSRIVELEQQVAALQENEKQREEEQRKSSIRQALQERRRNVLIHGAEDPGTWETKEESLKHAQKILQDVLEIENGIVIEDCHRLPQNPALKQGKMLRDRTLKKTRPIIIKVKDYFMVTNIWKNVSKLKEHNKEAEENGGNKISISRHLPRELQQEREKLVPDMIKARKKGKQARIKYNDETVHMYLDID